MIDYGPEYLRFCFRGFPSNVGLGMILVFCVGTVLLLAFLGWKKGAKWSSRLLLLEYLILIIALSVLLRPIQTGKAFNLTPFWSHRAVQAGNAVDLLAQIIANVAAFIPIGLLLGCAFGRMKWWKVLLIGGGFSLLIEMLQFILKRGFAEVDDLIHNVLGCAIGYGIYVGVDSIVKWIQKKRNTGELAKEG